MSDRTIMRRPQHRFALDRDSVRRTDADGHLHVALNPISKANISEYYGSEIPDAEELGLQPDRVYRLYRDPDELRKAARSFDGKPLLLVHKPQSASDHSRELTVGSVKNVEWDPPFLKAELDIWDGEAIAGIQSGDQRELSCGYRYVADMRPGQIGGMKYDGRMTNIQGNHVALVPTGRVGSDVVVGDSKPRSSKMKMARDYQPDGSGTEEPDYQKVYENLTLYLEDILDKDQMAEVNSILDGNDITRDGNEPGEGRPPPKTGLEHGRKDLAGDAVRAQRQALDRRLQVPLAWRVDRGRRVAMDQRSEDNYNKMFPHANRLQF